MTRRKEQKPRTTQVMELLQSGPMTTAALVAATGMTAESVHTSICSLAKHGLLDSLPVRYQLTAKGLYRIDPKADPEYDAKVEATRLRKQRNNQRYRDAKRIGDEQPIKQRIVRAPHRAGGVVRSAIESRPAFQAAWC